MAYENEENISFARKYRPTSISGYIGNETVKETVRRYLKNGRPQSILLTGASGCGKTTMARLLVKEYLCENRGEDGACNECFTCKSLDEYITTGNSEALPDIYEIDSSDKSGKKDIDAMLSSMEYPPMAGQWKVYIIDEVHLLSEGAMGRLLKSLEEPPEGVLLIFCTTNPEKLLDTIRNRCQLKLQVSKPSIRDIVELLQKVCLYEGKKYDVAGLRMIASHSESVVRDSLNNIERVINTRGDATSKSVSAEFKEVSDNLIFKFYEYYIEKNYMEYITLLYRIKTEYSFDQFLISLSNFTTRGIYLLNGVELEDLSEDEMVSYVKLFKKLSPQQISTIISELKKMRYGDIEVNFMAFIYTNADTVQNGDGTTTVTIKESPTGSEQKLRNSSLQDIEKAMLKNGEQSLESEMSVMGFEDMEDMFTVEKVRNSNK